MTAKTRRERMAEATRSAIIEGAGRAFAERGYRAATMADIAAEADLKAPSLYTYFAGKEAILLALGERLVEEVTEVIAEIDAEAAFDDSVRAVVGAILAWIDTRGGVMRFFLTLERSGDPIVSAIRRRAEGEDGDVRIGDAISGFFVRLLAAHPGASRFGASSLAAALFGMIDSFALRWRRDAAAARDGAPPISAYADEVADIFLNGATGAAR